MISKNNKLYHSKIRKKMNHKKFNKMKFKNNKLYHSNRINRQEKLKIKKHKKLYNKMKFKNNKSNKFYHRYMIQKVRGKNFINKIHNNRIKVNKLNNKLLKIPTLTPTSNTNKKIKFIKQIIIYNKINIHP